MNIFKLKNRNKILAWSFYDFANQPFTTIIVTFIYSSFFIKEIAYNEDSGTVMWTNAITITAISVSVLSPILGVIADRSAYRKVFLMLSTWICAIATIFLYFPEKGDIFFSLSLFIFANIAFELGTVFSNTYLHELSTNKNSGSISGFAWGLGFIGGLLALFLAFYLFDLSDSNDIKKINILVGIWIIIFSVPAFLLLKEKKERNFEFYYILDSFRDIQNTFKKVSKYKIIVDFLIARLFYNDGLITIFALGGIYAVGTLDFTFNEVMLLGIVLNITAALGSFFFGYLEDKLGFKKIINISLIVLIFATFLAYLAPEVKFSKEIFWFSGVLIGLMAGPNQSSSRSLMARLTPKEKQNEFFGFFALTGKATSFFGPFIFGIVTLFYNQQVALWIVIFLFFIGLFLFNRINFNSLTSH